MSKKLLALLCCLGIAAGSWWILNTLNQPRTSQTGAPPYGEDQPSAPAFSSWENIRRNWKRPNSPPKVALQIGHLENQDVPAELEKIRGNTGATSGEHTEVEVNKKIAEETAEVLKKRGVTVEILPATVPPDYWADVFVAIHADGSTSSKNSGFKVAAPWLDPTGKSADLAKHIESSYHAQTQLKIDPNVTRNMRGYYAFAWWRYEHSIHPMTNAVILETGFLTNPQDRKVIVDQPQKVATALSDGIIAFLKAEQLLK